MQNPSCGTDPGLPAANDLGDALDFICAARELVDLICLACRCTPSDDAKAISAGAYAVLAKIEAASDILEHLWSPGAVA